MSKMGQELEKRLDENKYELLEALRDLLYDVEQYGTPQWLAKLKAEKVIDKIDGSK